MRSNNRRTIERTQIKRTGKLLSNKCPNQMKRYYSNFTMHSTQTSLSDLVPLEIVCLKMTEIVIEITQNLLKISNYFDILNYLSEFLIDYKSK